MKKQLIVSVLVIAAFLVISLNLSVLAANPGFSNLVLGNNTQQTGNSAQGNDVIETVNTSNAVNNASVNTPDKLANTGLESLPWLAIGVCVVTAVFAFAKIKEYKAY